jgi:IS4 transposase
MHVAFSVFEQVPVDVSVTHGNASERQEFKQFVQPGGFSVADRGCANNALFREFDERDVRFVIRVQENTAFDVQEERPLSEADREAGVARDVLVRRLGTEKHNPLLKRPLRIVQVQGSEPGQAGILATNARELPADLVATAYRCRRRIELFFRWIKCVPGCKHLMSQSQSGVALPVYCAILAALLIG